MPNYKVLAHRRVQKFLAALKDENLKHSVKEQLKKLQDYPLTLNEMDTKKIKGLDKTFRIRIGKYRIIFHVDKDKKTIYVTHAETRKKVYSNF